MQPGLKAFRALQHRNYRLFFMGQIISLIGTWMQIVAQGWLVYRLSQSSLYLGLVGFAGQIPVLLLAPVAGVWADQVSKRKLIIATQVLAMVQALILAALTLTDNATVLAVAVLAFLLGVSNAFDVPGRQAFIVELVGKRDLMNAIALNSTIFNGARMVGPAIAGLLVAAIGEGYCFLLNGISYIAVIAGLVAMKLPEHRRIRSAASMFGRFKEGYHYVHRTRPVRALLLLLALLSIAGIPYTILMPVIADRILQGGPQALGILLGASGVGSLLGALSLTLHQGVKGLGIRVARASIAFGILLTAFSFSRSFWLSVALLVPVGFAFMVQMASTNTLIQSMVPDHLRGRVMSFYSMMFLGMAPFGSLLAGYLAKLFGVPATVGLGGIACLLGGIIFLIRLPELRDLAAPMLEEREAELV